MANQHVRTRWVNVEEAYPSQRGASEITERGQDEDRLENPDDSQ